LSSSCIIKGNCLGLRESVIKKRDKKKENNGVNILHK